MSTRRRLAGELADLALVVTHIVRQEFKSSAGPAGPTFGQFKMLHAIKNGVRRVGKLSEMFGISQPATSLMVDAMVKDGLVKRVPDQSDRRQIELHLTAKASARIDAIYKRAFANIDKRLTGVSAASKTALAGEIREITRLLSKQE